MLAGVTVWPSRTVTALHRTFLKPDGSGKASIDPDRKMLGDIAGGTVRLASPAAVMVAGEGIETCLAAQQATGMPVWSALSTSGLISLILPPLPLCREIFIAVDNDDAGRLAAGRAAERWIGEGRIVRLAIPNAGKDFNDLLRMT